MLQIEPELELSVVITVVSGNESVRENLAVLTPQMDFEKAEVIVPYDGASSDVGGLAADFPEIDFVFIEGAALSKTKADEHRLFDKRRAVGLGCSRGRIIAMTEDHASPAPDWINQILAAHEQPYDIIGGAVENGIEKPLNWALYYCDFGRYGRPFETGEASYLSDVNISYKREALFSVRDIWIDAYQETSVHWELKRNGRKLFLDDRPAVYQNRKGVTFLDALRERVGWGRIFAETRVREISSLKRLFFALSWPLLPFVMTWRILGHMRRQRQLFGVVLLTLPLVFVLLISWAWGEFLGYFFGAPEQESVDGMDRVDAVDIGRNNI